MSQIYNTDWRAESALVDATKGLLRALRAHAVVTHNPPPDGVFEDWFVAVQRCHVDATSITPAMLRLLFEFAYVAAPAYIVGVGTGQGLPMSAIVAGAVARRDEQDVEAVGVDQDYAANEWAAANAYALRLNSFLTYRTVDGVSYLGSRRKPIDLLYLDLDDPLDGKAQYATVFEHARHLLRRDGVVLAHDATSTKFLKDIAAFRQRLESDGRFSTILTVPIDAAGLLLAASAAPRRSEVAR